VLDWDDLRFLLSLEREGTLSAAGEQLRVTQSTVGRRLGRLESCLGVRLMERTPNGYVATPVAKSILSEVERIELGVLSIVRIAGERDRGLKGTVRIACVEAIANHILVPSLTALHSAHPDIIIELSHDTRNLSLAMREADIGVRFVRPNQHEVIVRSIGTVAFGLYASHRYLDRTNDLQGRVHTLILPDGDDVEVSPQTSWLGEAVESKKVVLRTKSYEAQVSCAVNGGGLACLPRFHAARHDGLAPVSTAGEPPSAEVYLTVHRDNRDTPRFRVVMQSIVESVRAASIRDFPSERGADEAEHSCVAIFHN
jgi:DNA-binding transcriptional LysR family regulator